MKKNSFYILLFFCISILFINCDDQESINLADVKDVGNQNHNSLVKSRRVISFNKIKTEIKHSFQEVSNAELAYKQREKLNYHYNQIVEVIDSLGNTAYTIPFNIKNQERNIYYNLIIGENNKENVFNPYVLKYKINNLDELYVKNQLNMDRFSGSIERYTFKKFLKLMNVAKKESGSDQPCDKVIYNNSTGGGGTSTSGNEYYYEGYEEDSEGAGGGYSCSWKMVTSSWEHHSSSTLFIDCTPAGGEYEVHSKTSDPCPDSSSVVHIGLDPNCPEGRDKNGNCYEKPEEDKIDDSQLKGKEKCLHELLNKQENSYIKSILKKFEGNSEFNIKIKSSDRVISSRTGREVNGNCSPPKNGIITININKGKSNSNPALEVTRTILHEYIHADIFRKLKSKTPTSEDLDFRDTYKRYEEQFSNEIQHEAMADLYINSMKNALKNFHKNVLTDDYNKFINYYEETPSDTFYEALAWRGLRNHDVKAYADLSDERKAELETEDHKIGLLTKDCPNSN